MPRIAPTLRWQFVRNLTEKFRWRDRKTGLFTTGYNPPVGAKELTRVPFHIKFVTKTGRLEECDATCYKVDRRKHLRLIRIESSVTARQRGNFRYVWDFLIIEIDGTRIV